MEGGNGKWGHRKGGNLKQIKYNLDKKQFYFDDKTNTAVDKTGFIPCVYQSGQMCSFILQLSHQSVNIINYLNDTFKFEDGVWQQIDTVQKRYIKLNPLGNDSLYDFKKKYDSNDYWCKIILDISTSQPLIRFYCVVNTDLQCEWKDTDTRWNQWKKFTENDNRTIIAATRKGQHSVNITVQVEDVDKNYSLDFDSMVETYIPVSNDMPVNNKVNNIRFILPDNARPTFSYNFENIAIGGFVKTTELNGYNSITEYEILVNKKKALQAGNSNRLLPGNSNSLLLFLNKFLYDIEHSTVSGLKRINVKQVEEERSMGMLYSYYARDPTQNKWILLQDTNESFVEKLIRYVKDKNLLRE